MKHSAPLTAFTSAAVECDFSSQHIRRGAVRNPGDQQRRVAPTRRRRVAEQPLWSPPMVACGQSTI
jgi:hypothetical protein